MSLSEDNEWLVVSTHHSASDPGNEKTYIFTGVTEGNLTLLQVLNKNGYHHKLSKDKKYLISTSETQKVFVNCGVLGDNYYFNFNLSECVECNVVGCLECFG